MGLKLITLMFVTFAYKSVKIGLFMASMGLISPFPPLS